MKVLHIIQSRNFAGSEQYMLTLCRGLAALGHECAVAIVPGGRLEAICKEQGMRIAPVPMRGLLTGRRLAAWVQREGVDVIHTHLTGAARLGLAAARRCGIPCFAHLHIYRADRRYARVAHYERGCLIAVSQHLADYFHAHLELPPERVKVVINATAVQGAPETGADATATVRGELGLPTAARLLLLAGRLSQGKGQDIAIRALPAILAAHPGTHLLLAGVAKRGTRVEQELQALAADAGVTANVHFLGFRRDVPRLMQAADICLLPSRIDVMPLVAVEAMRLRCCLVAARVGGLPEIVDDGRTGVLFEPESPAALAAAVTALQAEPARIRQLAHAAGDYAATAFDPVEMSRKVETLYNALRHG